MKKIVVEVTLSSNNSKRSIMKAVANLNGIKSMKIDEKQSKLTIVGTVDPVDVIEALRKKSKAARIVSVGPPEPERAASAYMQQPWISYEPRAPAYPYYNYNDLYKPALQYGSGGAPYEEQPSGCVIV